MEDKKYPKMSERDQLRKATHLYFEQVAELFRESGINQRMVLDGLKNYGDLMVTKDFFKSIYREIAIQKKFIEKSTQELSTIQAKEVEEEFTNNLQTVFGATLPEFPSMESLMYRQSGWTKEKPEDKNAN